MENNLYSNLALIRERSPLILNITNLVTMDFVANGLLAIGASPVMSNSEQELEELIKIASCVVINIGTLDHNQIIMFEKAVQICGKLNKKVILDPVGSGATSYRTNTALKLLSMGHISIIKGNASEIMSLSGDNVNTKGVDSSNSTDDAVDAASRLAKKYNICVVVSGKKDLIINEKSHQYCDLGHKMMSQVTGMGCLLSAIVGAFHTVCDDAFEASVDAVNFFGLTGKIASENPTTFGTASFRSNFIDTLYNLRASKNAI